MKLSKKKIALAVAALGVAALAATRLSHGDAAHAVELARVEAQEIRPTVLASGALAYRTEVGLTSEVTGKVREILVQEGERVEKGQLLLRLDPESYRNAIERETANHQQQALGIARNRLDLDLRKKQYERTRRLYDSGMVGKNKLDEDSNALHLAEVELQASSAAQSRANAVLAEAREQLGKTEVRAPISGLIVQLPIKVGETAIPSNSSVAGSSLMKLADTSELLAELKVDEGDIMRVRAGQRADVFPASQPDKPLSGKVEKIALSPNTENQSQGRNYRVTVKLDVPAGTTLRSGMSSRAELHLSEGARRNAVPIEAVLQEKQGQRAQSYVWVARAGKARKVKVALGQADDRWQEIQSGIAAGEQVVTGPVQMLQKLKEGDAVRAKPAEESKHGSAA